VETGLKKPLSIWLQVAVCSGILIAGYAALQGSDTFRQLVGLEANSVQPGEQSPSRSEGRPGVPVIVSPVMEVDDTLTYATVGTGIASRSVMLRSEVEGNIKSSMLASGKRFARGDILLELDDRDQLLALRLAETRLEKADRDRDRLEDLRKRGITPETVYQEAVTKAALALLELEQARAAVEDRQLLAPFDGVSGLPSVEAGDHVETGTELASFDDRQNLMVEFDLPESLLTRVSEGDEVSGTTPGVPGKTFIGIVDAIDSRIDPEKRSVRVRVKIPNEDDLLRPGASFSITIDLKGSPYPAVPELALQFTSGALYVWKIEGDTSEKVEVALIRRRAGRVLLDGALSQGDLVAVEGMQRLSPGRSVQILGQQEVAN